MTRQLHCIGLLDVIDLPRIDGESKEQKIVVIGYGPFFNFQADGYEADVYRHEYNLPDGEKAVTLGHLQMVEYLYMKFKPKYIPIHHLVMLVSLMPVCLDVYIDRLPPWHPDYRVSDMFHFIMDKTKEPVFKNVNFNKSQGWEDQKGYDEYKALKIKNEEFKKVYDLHEDMVRRGLNTVYYWGEITKNFTENMKLAIHSVFDFINNPNREANPFVNMKEYIT